MANLWNSTEEREAINYLRDRVIGENTGKWEDDPSSYLNTRGAYLAAGVNEPTPVAVRKPKEESSFWGDIVNYIHGVTGDEAKEQQENFAEYNKSKQQELSNPSAPGTYSFGYNNGADYNVSKVAKAIANGDLKESNQQLYRRYYDSKSNKMLYETVPIASIDKYGAVKPYEYKPSLLEKAWNVATSLSPGDPNINVDISNMDAEQFKAKARAKIDTNNLGHAAYEGLNTLVDAFDPTEFANSVINHDRKTRSNIEELRDDGGKTSATSIAQKVGKIGGAGLKMYAGGALGGALGSLANLGTKGTQAASLLTAGMLPEIGEHSRAAIEDGDYLNQGVRLGLDNGLNALGMKIG
jgi:hypothetical protein